MPELVDCHTHTVFSDGKSTLDENLQAAVDAGLSVIACTDHWASPAYMDCSIDEDKLGEYGDAIIAARQRYDSLEIVHGLECDWYPGCAGDIARARRGATFLLGSVHYLRGMAIDFEEDVRIWEELGADEVWGLYVEEWCKAASNGIFDSMAHPDLPRMFAGLGYVPTRAMSGLYKDMAEAAHEGGVHAEINTSGLNKCFKEFYPCEELLREFLAAEVPLTVGSDAHWTSRIGEYIEQAYRHARRIGYRSIDVPCVDGDWRSISLEEA